MSGLYGSHYVFPTTTAITRAWKLAEGSAREHEKLRRHALKLANFPDCGDWDWIAALPRQRIGELRIDEPIAGKRNVRVIFFKANAVLDGDPQCAETGSTMPRIWTITTFDKKSNDFSMGQIRAFAAAKKLIVFRYYGGNAAA